MTVINLNASDVEIDLANVKQNSMIAVNAFHEYVSNSLTKVKDFLRDDIQTSSVLSLAVPDSDSEATLMAITKEQYNTALNDLDGSTTLVDSAGNEHVILNEQITNIIMDTTSELAVQKEYLGCCLSGVQFTVTDMLTRVKSLFPGVSGDILSKYSALIDNSSVINSIQNLFQLNKFIDVDKDDNDVIKIYTKDGYTGANVWCVVLQQIGDQLAYFFRNVVWENITKIGQFFGAILEGLKNLAIWLVGRVCSQLLTNYSKASSNIGVVDFPVTQICLGTIESLDQTTGDFRLNIDCFASGSIKSNLVELAGDAEDEILSRNHTELHNYDHCRLTGYHNLYYKDLSNQYACGYDETTPTGLWTIYASYIYNMAYIFIKECMMTNNKEGVIMPRPVDVTIPMVDLVRYAHSKLGFQWVMNQSLFDVTLRFGLDDMDQVWMQVFVCDTYDHLHSYTDKQNYARMINTFGFLTMVCGFNLFTIPNIDVTNYSLDEYLVPTMWYGSNSNIFNKLLFTGTYTDPEQEGTYDLVGALHSVNMINTLYNSRFNPESVDSGCRFVHRSTDGLVLAYNLLSYALYNSKCHELNLADDEYVIKLKSDVFSFSKNITLPSIGYACMPSKMAMSSWQDTNAIKLFDYDYTDYFNNWTNNVFQPLFVPYQKSELIPISIHYQTLDEQATEIRHAIIAVLVAAALIYVSYKIIKFNKSRKMKTQLAQAAMDQFSWDFAKDPSPENFKKFSAARKKYKKMSLMNHILGVSSSAAIESTSSNFDSLFQNLKGIQTGDEEDSISIKSIQNLITGS